MLIKTKQSVAAIYKAARGKISREVLGRMLVYSKNLFYLKADFIRD